MYRTLARLAEAFAFFREAFFAPSPRRIYRENLREIRPLRQEYLRRKDSTLAGYLIDIGDPTGTGIGFARLLGHRHGEIAKGLARIPVATVSAVFGVRVGRLYRRALSSPNCFPVLVIGRGECRVKVIGVPPSFEETAP